MDNTKIAVSALVGFLAGGLACFCCAAVPAIQQSFIAGVRRGHRNARA